MVEYGQPRTYITPQDHPIGSTLEGVITKITEEHNDNGKKGTYYRLTIEENETGLFTTMNVGDYITPINNHGKLIRSIFGESYFAEQKYNDPVAELFEKEVRLQVIEWTSKLDKDGNQINYPKFSVLLPKSKGTPPQKKVTQVKPSVAIPETCDHCEKPLNNPDMILYLEQDGEEYQFCSQRCKTAFLS